MRVESRAHHRTAPDQVHPTLRRKLLVDGFPFVYDPDASHDAWLVDARDGTEYLDLFSFFASLPVGYGHPGLADAGFRERLLQASLLKPTNSDVYSQAQADFIETFSRTLPPSYVHLFFVEGGAMAVENALKVAFDWKVRKNIAAGRGEGLGTKVLHFRNAFHGRSGYTLSLTNTFDPRKTAYFPKFDWPRVSTPGLRFPVTEDTLREVEAAERRTLDEIRAVFERNPHDIAAIILETIQGEGGDVHFRPEFLHALRQVADEQEALLIFDEVQAGMGITGRWWAFEHAGAHPDIFAFGKKSQVCGIAATSRVDEVESVFKVPSRINSTWGGNLADMVRCERFIEIIEDWNLLENARTVGEYALERLRELESGSSLVSNARGKGLLCAFDLPDTAIRDTLKKRLLEHEKVIMLASGARSLRFRPVLDFTQGHVDVAVGRIAKALEAVA